MKYRIFPLGTGAATIDFGNRISAAANDRVLKLARFFELNPFAGFREAVPAYSSLAVFYDVVEVRRNNPHHATAFAAVRNFADDALKITARSRAAAAAGARKIRIPVCFDEEFAPDLDFIAGRKNLSRAEAIEIFLGRTYRVFMLGFLPGFSYMGEVDARIVTGRKASPRLKVPAGSVGIAGRQTGIYSLESPGGWQIIGRTPLEVFTPAGEKPALLHPGDRVEFYAVDRGAFAEPGEG